MAEAAAIMDRTEPRLRGGLRCILLAGGLKPTPVAAGAGMPALRLFPDGQRSLLNNWIHRIGELSDLRERPDDPLEMRIIFDKSRDALEAPVERGGVDLIFESESAAYRGPAGVAHDVSASFPDEATVLIAEANRWLDTSLAPLFAEHLERRADVTIARHCDGAPAGVYLARKEALSRIAPKGFIDLKEQWLTTLMKAGLHVFVHTLEGRGSVPIRTREDLLELGCQLVSAGERDSHPLNGSIVGGVRTTPRERWSVVSDRATVHESATILGSIVMPGAVVREHAVLARSIAPPGSVVEAGREIVDDIVRGDAMVASTMSATVWERNR